MTYGQAEQNISRTGRARRSHRTDMAMISPCGDCSIKTRKRLLSTIFSNSCGRKKLLDSCPPVSENAKPPDRLSKRIICIASTGSTSPRQTMRRRSRRHWSTNVTKIVRVRFYLKRTSFYFKNTTSRIQNTLKMRKYTRRASTKKRENIWNVTLHHSFMTKRPCTQV